MKKYICCLILLLCSFYIHAQTSQKLDSLKKVLAKLPPEGRSFVGDTTRVKVLCEMGDAFLNYRKDSSIILGLMAFQIAQSNKYKLGEMKANIIVGKYYNTQSQYVKSSEYLLKALVIAESFNLKQELIYLTSEIGTNYLTLGEGKRAINFFQKHSKLCHQYGTKEDYLLSFNNIGVVYFNQKNYEKALTYFKICEQGSKQINSPKVKNVGLINVAMVLSEMGKYDEALTRYDKALKIDDGYKDRLAFISNAKAKIFLKQNKLSLALLNANYALENTKKTNPFTLKNVTLTLSNVYQKMNLPVKALEYYKQFSELSLNQDSTKNSQIIRFMNLDYQNEKQVQQIKELNYNAERQKLQRNIAIIISILVLIILSFTYFFYKSLQKKNFEIEKQKIAIEELNQTLEKRVDERTKELSFANEKLIRKNQEIIDALFKGQTIERKRVASELHDNLGSTLSAIKWRLEALNSNNLSEKERKIYGSILDMMKNAYTDVRNISHNLLPAEFEEKGLFGALNHLCNSISNEGKMKLITSFDINDTNINSKVAVEIYSICMELINNILKHSKATEATVKFREENGYVIIDVKDNGIGIQESTNGKGLQNIRERLQSVTNDYQFEVDSANGLAIKLALSSLYFFNNASPISG